MSDELNPWQRMTRTASAPPESQAPIAGFIANRYSFPPEMFGITGGSVEIDAHTAHAVKLALSERLRQVHVKGYTDQHDDDHEDSELAIAAACYLVHGTGRRVLRQVLPGTFLASAEDAWPWDEDYDKREERGDFGRVVIAAGLVIAELERLLRKGDNL